MNEKARKETFREVGKCNFVRELSGEIKLAKDATPANSRNPAITPRSIRGIKSWNKRVSRKYLRIALSILTAIYSVNHDLTLRKPEYEN